MNLKRVQVVWRGAAPKSHYGAFIPPNGSIFVPAHYAVQLHRQNNSWVCPNIEEVEKALAEEVPQEPVLTPDDEKVKADEEGKTPSEEETPSEEVPAEEEQPRNVVDAERKKLLEMANKNKAKKTAKKKNS